MTDLQYDLGLVDLIGGDNPRAALLGSLLFVLGAVLGFWESPREARCYRGHGCGDFLTRLSRLELRFGDDGLRRDLDLEKELQASGAFRTSMHGQWLGGS